MCDIIYCSLAGLLLLACLFPSVHSVARIAKVCGTVTSYSTYIQGLINQIGEAGTVWSGLAWSVGGNGRFMGLFL